ncbi:MAG TPA: glutamine--tRNA ligase/YqeY domain fusion protein, partial [Thermoanaerobaculia bacterium]|nr:glutamine--tRNA ligase/YqeY domain fusion protein [Thermoanaerobaculia bacterium]
HIGHAKSICLNFGLPRDFGGYCNLRFDDSNPLTEDVEYVEAIQRDVRWLGFDWEDRLYFASDYFERLYELAELLVNKGLAYVDSSTEDEIRAERGTVTEPGTPSRYRDRSVAENLDLLRRMRAGELPDGAAVLRARIDMAAANMKMRDPLLYRIRHAEHYRRGDAWCIYPMYDFIHPLSDAIEGITHSLCTLEFENNRELYDWLLAAVDWPEPRPHQYEFARLNLNYTVMSKRKLLELVESGLVQGWDDPRMPTLSGLRRRGYTPEAIRSFCDRIGVAKAHSTVDVALLEHAVREDLNTKAPRVLCVLRPLKLVVENWPEGRVETFDAPFWPHDVPKEGSRGLPFSRELWIEREDFAEVAPKGWHRLSPGAEVRLRYAYVVRCTGVSKDERGEVVEVRCTYDPATQGGAAPAGHKVPGTLHWVSAAHAVDVEVRLYDRLFRDEQPDTAGDYRQSLNPDSLEVIAGAKGEPGIAAAEPGSRFQFERQGYFYLEPESAGEGRKVFNRIVTLKDTWAKLARRQTPAVAGAEAGEAKRAPAVAAARATPGEPSALPPEAAALQEAHGIGVEAARVLAAQPALRRLFDGALAAGASPRSTANWIANELQRELEEIGVDLANAPFGGAELAELLALVDDGTLSATAGKAVLAELVRGGGSPRAIVAARGLAQVSDAGELGAAVARVVAREEANAAAYRGGRTGLLGWFVGQVMRETGGRANPQLVQRLVRERLDAASG